MGYNGIRGIRTEKRPFADRVGMDAKKEALPK
jgi:hypothetical protein